MRTFETIAQLQAALDLPPLAPAAFRFAKQFGPAAFRCVDCGEAKPLNTEGMGGTGYARVDTPKGEALCCYECCGKRDTAAMIETGKGVLYLTLSSEPATPGRPKRATLTNWPGTLKFPAGNPAIGRHNIAGRRYDVWFTGPDGLRWHGVTYGDMTQICHVKRLKAPAAKAA